MGIDTNIRIHINKTSARELYLQGGGLSTHHQGFATVYIVADFS